MSIMTIVFFAVLVFFVWRGYKKGFSSSIAQILSLIIAYPTAIFLTNPVANLIYSHTPLTGMLVYFISGSAIFFIVSLIVTAIVKGCTNLIPTNQFTQNSSRFGGASIGIIVGSIAGLIIVYAISFVQKPKDNNVNTYAAQTQIPPGDAFIESTAKTFVSAAATTAVDFALQDKTATDITKVFAEHPQEMMEHAQKLSDDAELKIVMADPQIQTLLKSGDTKALLQDWKFQHLMNNEDLQAILVSADDKKDGKFSQQAAAEKIVAVLRRTDAIKNDPRVTSILGDPEFQQQLHSSNKLPLMMNAKLKALTDIIFSNHSQAEHNPIEDILQQAQTQEPEQPANKNPFAEVDAETERTTIYRWTDSSGNLHYSDQAVKK